MMFKRGRRVAQSFAEINSKSSSKNSKQPRDKNIKIGFRFFADCVCGE
jgi:hypothetical protein